MSNDEDEVDRLDEALDRVNSRDSFLQFVKELQRDLEEELRQEAESPSSPYGPGANGWVNHSIEGFLKAMPAWAVDSEAVHETA